MALDYNKLGNCIDNIYHNQAIDASRKVISTLKGDVLSLRFVTIKEFARESDKVMQEKAAEDEAIKCISIRLKEIKDMYKEMSGESLSTKAIKDVSPMSYEVMTTSPFSIKRVHKINYVINYTLS